MGYSPKKMAFYFLIGCCLKTHRVDPAIHLRPRVLLTSALYQLTAAMIYGFLLVVSLVATAYTLRSSRSRVPRGLRLPPGPPRRFLIGNLLDMPQEKQWLTYNKWAKTYGDLVYVEMLGTSILLVNSADLVRELFEKRGAIYSNRYNSVVLNELIGMGWTIIMMPYGEVWRRFRGVFSQFFTQSGVKNYHSLHLKHTKVFLRKLYETPEKFLKHTRYGLGAIILETAYGLEIKPENEYLMELSEHTIHKVTEAAVPGRYLADVIPFLKYVPAWFPGAGFQNELSILARQVITMLNTPVSLVKESMKNGTAVPSVASTLIERYENNPDAPEDFRDIIRFVPGIMYVAGIDTMEGAMITFFLAMLLHPQAQRNAQAELDSVIEPGALPSFEDRESLPYLRALLKEVLRWNTTANVAVPHVLDQDDIIGDYFIPKNTIVMGNSWTMFRSKEIYGPDADEFRPERFFEGAKDPDWAFGYGRRICPGKLFGEDVLFITMVSVLYLFDILPVEDENGPCFPGDEDFESGLVLRPKPFSCKIIPRSPKAVDLLNQLKNTP